MRNTPISPKRMTITTSKIDPRVWKEAQKLAAKRIAELVRTSNSKKMMDTSPSSLIARIDEGTVIVYNTPAQAKLARKRLQLQG
jgi:hypothetical protein